MLLIYTKAPLRIGHMVTAFSDEYLHWIADHPEYGYIETDQMIDPLSYNLREVDGVVTLIPKQPFEITVDGGHVTGIPVGTMVSGDAGSCTMDDSGELELSFETPGSYVISFSHPDYLAKEITVEAVAA